MGYRPKPPNFQLASTASRPGARNDELDSFLRDVHTRLGLLETKNQAEGINLNRQAPLSPVAPKPGLSITSGGSGSGRWQVRLTLPQFTSPAVSGNETRTPLYHHVQYSPKSDFTADVQDLAKGYDVNHTVFSDAGQSLTFRARSSFDGIRWSPWVLHAPVAA